MDHSKFFKSNPGNYKIMEPCPHYSEGKVFNSIPRQTIKNLADAQNLKASKVKVTQLCPPHVTPWTIHKSMEFSLPESWNGELIPSPGDLPNPGIEPSSPAL